MSSAKILFQVLNPLASMPTQATKGAAGFDLKSVETRTIYPGERATIATGLAMAIPAGYEGQVRPRSGLAAKNGITVLNTPGTVDSDYRGEVKVILYNSESHKPFEIKIGDRIAQMVIQAVPQVEFELVESLDETERGAGGFGSTGK